MNKNFTKVDLEIVYEQNVDRIYKFFYLKTLSKETAQDLTSDTFLSFVERIKKNDLINNPCGFLYGTAKNIFINFLKRKYKDQKFWINIEKIEDFQVEVSSVNEDKIIEVAKKFIDKLPEKQKKVLTLRLVEKLSIKKITEILNKNVNYVKTTQKRGIANLRKFLMCTPDAT